MALDLFRVEAGFAIDNDNGGTPVETSILNGNVDPSAGGGVVANAGSMYQRNTAGADGGELWLKYGDADTEWVLFAASGGVVGSEDAFQNTYMGKTAGGSGNENPTYSSTNIVSGSLTTAIGALDAEIGAAVSGNTRTVGAVSDQAVNSNIEALDDAIGTDAQLASTETISTANSVNQNLSALDAEIGNAVSGNTRTVGAISDQDVNSNLEALDDAIGTDAQMANQNIIDDANSIYSNLSLLDGAVSALQSGLQWIEEVDYVTADDLSARTGIAGANSVFSDNDGGAVTLVNGDRIYSTNDDTIYIVNTGGAWTTAPALNPDETFFTYNNFLDPVNQEKGAAFRYNGAALVKVADMDFELADSINLTSGYSASNGTVTASDTIETAISKLDANQADIITLTGVAQGAVDLGTFTGTTIADNSTIKAALQALETEVETKPETLAQVLVNGNVTGANDIIVSSGQAITGVDAAVGGTLSLLGGNGTTTDGGNVSISGGDAFATSDGDGGDVIITGGAKDDVGADGNIHIGDSQTSQVTIHSLVYPNADGDPGQVLATDGSGNLGFVNPGATQTAQSTITNTSVVLDSVLVDEHSAAKWLVTFVDAANSRRNAVEVYATHNGLAAADATLADNTQYAILKANGKITAVTLSVGLNGTGAAQVMRLIATVASGTTVDLRAARVSVNF